MGLTTVDASVLVPALQRMHASHRLAAVIVRRGGIRVGGHVLTETYSILTGGRAGPRARPADVLRAFDHFGAPLALSAEGFLDALRRCAAWGAVGGAVHDAIVGATAREAGARLISRDLRAARTYEVLGVDYELIG